ncbi:MAG: 23S rRNA (cytosine1962-C5)-methyltransferase [Bacteroidia bacterium]|jgi:23S rRNA (cytosine1962-C5)-methyltransferase
MSKSKQSSIQPWSEYSLIDCGDGRKLERFGSIVLIRPEPAAIWGAKLSPKEWDERAHAECVQMSNNKAEWKHKKQFNHNWIVGYPLKGKLLKFNLQLTRFKHVGLFPEHFVNWNYIHDSVKKMGPSTKVLNLFAYTGGASLAAKLGGADVVHVDSIKQVISWAKSNMVSSGLKDIRWVVEDALKFVAREQKRGNTYSGVILDPPAFGLGAKGERWKLEDSIQELMQKVDGILDKKQHFVVLNTYSPGFTPLVVENILKSTLSRSKHVSSKELFLQSESGYKMPTGVTGIATSQ